jgi:hypothetical protein
MTLNVEPGIPPSSNTLQANSSQGTQPNSSRNPSQGGQSNGSRRRYTVGSPTSSPFKPAVPGATAHINHQFPPPPLSQNQEHPPRSFSTEQHARPRGSSPSPQTASSGRRRQVSKSPERGQERSQGASWAGNGRKNNHWQQSKYSAPAMGARKNEAAPSITLQRPSFKSTRSNSSIQSNSLPSTPNHHPRHANGASRSPSPPCPLDSPRSAASEPVISTPRRQPHGGCIYETALANIRRRMPYSLGIEKLGSEKPKLERLSTEQGEKLTLDMEQLFERLKPKEGTGERRRAFLEKLEGLLNREWPGHGIKVHAFGSTENHLSMSDSDGM